MGTTFDLVDMTQTSQFCQGVHFGESPGSKGSTARTGAEDDDKRDTWTGKEGQQTDVMIPHEDKSVGTDKDDVEETILLPSSAVSSAVGGGGSAFKDDKDTPGMRGSQDNRILDDVVDNTRVSVMMLPDTKMKDEDTLSRDNSLMTMPSVGDEGYPAGQHMQCSTTTSKNFTVQSNNVVLEDESAMRPGVRMIVKKPAVRRDETPTQVVSLASQSQRECVHSKQGVCSKHVPGAKWSWRPGTKNVTDGDGVVRREKTKIYFWWCDLGPKGRGALR